MASLVEAARRAAGALREVNGTLVAPRAPAAGTGTAAPAAAPSSQGVVADEELTRALKRGQLSKFEQELQRRAGIGTSR